MIRAVIFGDVIGRCGRKTFATALEVARRKYNPHIVSCNGENLAGGFGITPAIYEEFTKGLKVDYITCGNHWNDRKEILPLVDRLERLTLPANSYDVRDETLGLKILPIVGTTFRFAVINVIGRVFMNDGNRSPFEAASRLLEKIPTDVKIRFVDVHAEATSEKQAMAFFLAGRVSVVSGTHSHVPTSDLRIINDHTGFVTDIGATGAYDSIIGMRKEIVLTRMLTGTKPRLEPAEGDPWALAIYVEIAPESGRCLKIERIQWTVKDMEQLGAPCYSNTDTRDHEE